MGALDSSEILVSCHEVEGVSKKSPLHMYTHPDRTVCNSSGGVTSWHANCLFSYGVSR